MSSSPLTTCATQKARRRGTGYATMSRATTWTPCRSATSASSTTPTARRPALLASWKLCGRVRLTVSLAAFLSLFLCSIVFCCYAPSTSTLPTSLLLPPLSSLSSPPPLFPRPPPNLTPSRVESAFDPSHPYHDPKSRRDAPTWRCVHVAFRRKFTVPVTLRRLQEAARAEGSVLAGLEVLRRGRLSVSRVSGEEWEGILGMAEGLERDAEAEKKAA